MFQSTNNFLLRQHSPLIHQRTHTDYQSQQLHILQIRVRFLNYNAQNSCFLNIEYKPNRIAKLVLGSNLNYFAIIIECSMEKHQPFYYQFFAKQRLVIYNHWALNVFLMLS